MYIEMWRKSGLRGSIEAKGQSRNLLPSSSFIHSISQTLSVDDLSGAEKGFQHPMPPKGSRYSLRPLLMRPFPLRVGVVFAAQEALKAVVDQILGQMHRLAGKGVQGNRPAGLLQFFLKLRKKHEASGQYKKIIKRPP